MSTAVDRRESRFRLTAAALVLAFWVILYLGGAWDVQWHSDVGPDHFWTPPHTMMYAGVAFAGLTALAVVIRTTLLFRRKAPGVSERTTTPWLAILRAPLGFIISGLGVVAFLFFGGFDEFWHQTYGFDVTLWSPPHIGLYISGIIGLMGVLYAFASEVARGRGRGDEGLLQSGSLGLMLTAAVMMDFAALPITPSLTEASIVGPVSFYPLLATAVYALGLAIPAAVLRRPGAATLTGLAVLGIRQGTLALTPVLVNWLAVQEDLPFKPDALGFTIQIAAIPVFLFVSGIVIDVALAAARAYRLSQAAALSAGAAGGLLLLWLLEKPWVLALDRLTFLARSPQVKAEMLAAHTARLVPSLGSSIVIAVVVGYLVWQFGIMLRYTDR